MTRKAPPEQEAMFGKPVMDPAAAVRELGRKLEENERRLQEEQQRADSLADQVGRLQQMNAELRKVPQDLQQQLAAKDVQLDARAATLRETETALRRSRAARDQLDVTLDNLKRELAKAQRDRAFQEGRALAAEMHAARYLEAFGLQQKDSEVMARLLLDLYEVIEPEADQTLLQAAEWHGGWIERLVGAMSATVDNIRGKLQEEAAGLVRLVLDLHQVLEPGPQESLLGAAGRRSLQVLEYIGRLQNDADGMARLLLDLHEVIGPRPDQDMVRAARRLRSDLVYALDELRLDLSEQDLLQVSGPFVVGDCSDLWRHVQIRGQQMLQAELLGVLQGRAAQLQAAAAPPPPKRQPGDRVRFAGQLGTVLEVKPCGASLSCAVWLEPSGPVSQHLDHQHELVDPPDLQRLQALRQVPLSKLPWDLAEHVEGVLAELEDRPPGWAQPAGKRRPLAEAGFEKGDLVITGYGTGPYEVKRVSGSSLICEGGGPRRGKNQYYLNDLSAVAAGVARAVRRGDENFVVRIDAAAAASLAEGARGAVGLPLDPVKALARLKLDELTQPAKVCGKCGSPLRTPGECPVCKGAPFGEIRWSAARAGEPPVAVAAPTAPVSAEPPGNAPAADAPPARTAALQVSCPKCKASPGTKCSDYRGAHCAPHGDRRRAAAAAPSPAPLAPSPAADPAPRAPVAEEGPGEESDNGDLLICADCGTAPAIEDEDLCLPCRNELEEQCERAEVLAREDEPRRLRPLNAGQLGAFAARLEEEGLSPARVQHLHRLYLATFAELRAARKDPPRQRKPRRGAVQRVLAGVIPQIQPRRSPCPICKGGKGQVHACCPLCPAKARTEEEVRQVFGVRTMNHKVHAQPRCRVCRSRRAHPPRPQPQPRAEEGAPL